MVLTTHPLLVFLHSQGCSEIRWLATKMGAKAATISGLSGGQPSVNQTFRCVSDCACAPMRRMEAGGAGAACGAGCRPLGAPPAVGQPGTAADTSNLLGGVLLIQAWASRIVFAPILSTPDWSAPADVFQLTFSPTSAPPTGLGDIMLTCYGSLSRNRTVGGWGWADVWHTAANLLALHVQLSSGGCA